MPMHSPSCSPGLALGLKNCLRRTTRPSQAGRDQEARLRLALHDVAEPSRDRPAIPWISELNGCASRTGTRSVSY